VTPHLQKRPGELNCRRLPKIAAGWHDLSREDFLLGFGAIQLRLAASLESAAGHDDRRQPTVATKLAL